MGGFLSRSLGAGRRARRAAELAPDLVRDLEMILLDSPQRRVAAACADAVADTLGGAGYVAFACAEPDLVSTARLMREEGMDQAIVVPADPHPRKLHHASVAEAFAAAWRAAGGEPSRLFIGDPWWREEIWRNAILRSLEESLGPTSRWPQLVFLAQGQEHEEATNDPGYEQALEASFRALCADSRLSGKTSTLAWVRPHIGEVAQNPEARSVLESLANAGVDQVALVPFGYASDRIETLHIVDIELARELRSHGMTSFRVPTLNDGAGSILALCEVVRRAARGLNEGNDLT